MLDKIKDLCDDIPEIWRAVIFVSAISIFWSIII
jgi:hypothetical protein